MERAEKVLEESREIIEQGEKPSASRISQNLQMPESDVHRCLNHLEKKGDVETYRRKIFGRKHRMVSVSR